jgi:hypothetical protein
MATPTKKDQSAPAETTPGFGSRVQPPVNGREKGTYRLLSVPEKEAKLVNRISGNPIVRPKPGYDFLDDKPTLAINYRRLLLLYAFFQGKRKVTTQVVV